MKMRSISPTFGDLLDLKNLYDLHSLHDNCFKYKCIFLLDSLLHSTERLGSSLQGFA